MVEKRVLAFHYAWYGTPWGPTGAWRAWNHAMTLNRQRVGQHDPDRILSPGVRDIGTALYPMDGPYDSRDVSTVRRQLSEAVEAGVDGFMLSWWGPGDPSDKVLEVWMAECPQDFICANVEPYARRTAGDSRDAWLEEMVRGMLYLLRTYSGSDRWVHMDGKPLMAIWRTEHHPPQDWQEIKDRIRAEGFEVFWLGQHYDTSYLPTLDGLCSYDPFVYSLQGIDLAKLYQQKRDEVKAAGCYFAATANPGFDNRALHKPGLHVPRENGGYYRMTWQASLNCDPDFIVINSYNEWGESSVIESTRQYGKDYIEHTREFAEQFKKAGG